MCSWCWGFQKVWPTIITSVKNLVEIQYLAGGLAPDSDLAMPQDMQKAIAGYWKNIQQRIPGTEFNFDFWKKCQARRSTYPACRAVVSAKILDLAKEPHMIKAIQHAYYLLAKNPSDNDTLINCAVEIGIEREKFENQFFSEETTNAFLEEMSISRNLGAHGFPTLILKTSQKTQNIGIDYNSAEFILEQIRSAL